MREREIGYTHHKNMLRQKVSGGALNFWDADPGAIPYLLNIHDEWVPVALVLNIVLIRNPEALQS